MTTFQTARPGDLAPVRELLTLAHLPAEDLTAATLEHFLVYRDGESLVAVVGLQPVDDTALLRSLVVRQDLLGRGIGAQLVAAAEARARALQVRELYLLTTTAAEYFRKRGYRRLERESAPTAIRGTSQFSALCPATATLMVKALHTGVAA
jgi:amino-acid N-acetyltransferase